MEKMYAQMRKKTNIQVFANNLGLYISSSLTIWLIFEKHYGMCEKGKEIWLLQHVLGIFP